MITPTERLIAHVVSTLPDSIVHRREILEDAIAIMPDGAARQRVETMLAYLHSHQRQQMEFSLVGSVPQPSRKKPSTRN